MGPLFLGRRDRRVAVDGGARIRRGRVADLERPGQGQAALRPDPDDEQPGRPAGPEVRPGPDQAAPHLQRDQGHEGRSSRPSRATSPRTTPSCARTRCSPTSPTAPPQANNPLFATRATNFGATNVYSQLAQGNITSTLAGLKSSKIRLTQERSLLNAEDRAAAGAAATAAKAYHEAQGIQASLNRALAQVKGAIANYIAAQEAAAARRAAGRIHTSHPGRGGYPAPPPDSRANIAIDAALSYIGTPYVWGGASRRGVDCSGLVMLAYAAAGIFFPHYSGAMYADTVRVPLWDLRPGDLLFYGYDGDQHVAMYLGHGKMIEAEETGTRVHVTPVRLGYGFAGAGRPARLGVGGPHQRPRRAADLPPLRARPGGRDLRRLPLRAPAPRAPRRGPLPVLRFVVAVLVGALVGARVGARRDELVPLLGPPRALAGAVAGRPGELRRAGRRHPPGPLPRAALLARR